MKLDATSLTLLTLLVFAASLASYLLSQWLALRRGTHVGRAGVALGAALLLSAVVVVMLATDLPSRIAAMQGVDANRASHVAGQLTFPAKPESALRPTQKSPSSARTNDPIGTPARQSTAPIAYPELTPAARSEATRPRARDRDEPRHDVRHQTLGEGPWAATKCVFAIRPDPAEPTHWWLDNGCGAPVGLLVAVCERSAALCDQPPSWRYVTGGMTLPAKMARSVTYAEQTQRGASLRFVACIVSDPRAIASIDRSAARTDADVHDACLTQIARWSAAGARAGQAIDMLLGPGLPGRVFQVDGRR